MMLQFFKQIIMKWTNSDMPRRNSQLARNSNDERNLNQLSQNNLHYQSGFQKNLIHDLRSQLNCLKSQFMKLTSKNSGGAKDQPETTNPSSIKQETHKSKFQRDGNKPTFNNKKQSERSNMRENYAGHPSYNSRNLSENKLHSANSHHQRNTEVVNISNEYQMNFPQKYIKNPSKLLLQKQEQLKNDASDFQSESSLLKKQKSSQKIGIEMRQQLQVQNQELRRKNRTLEGRVKELEEINKRQISDLMKSEEKIKALTLQKGQAKRLVSEIDKSKNELLFNLDTNQKQLSKVRNEWDQQKLIFENKANDFNLTLTIQQKEIQSLTQKQGSLRNQNQFLLKDLQKKIYKIEEQDRRIKKLDEQLVLSQQFEKKYQKIVQESQKEEKNKPEIINGQLDKQIEHLKQKMKSIESENKEKKYQNNELVKILNDKQNMIRNMFRDMKNLEKQISEIKRTNKNLQHLLRQDSEEILKLHLTRINSRLSQKYKIEDVHSF